MAENRVAVMPDGKRIVLPAGASDAAMDKAAKDYLSTIQQKPTPVTDSGSISATQPGWLESAVQSLRKYLPASSTPLINALPQNSDKQEFLSKAAPVIEAGVGLGATAGATAGGLPLATGAAIGSFAMPATNEIIRNYLNQGAGETSILPEMGGLGHVIEGGIKNELLGRIFGGAFEGATSSPTKLAQSTGVSDEALKLGGTTGQLTGSKLISHAEDAFARNTKEASVAQSSANAVARVADKTSTSNLMGLTDAEVGKLIYSRKNLDELLQTGTTDFAGQTITTTNGRRDLQGAIVNKIFRDNAKLGANGVTLNGNGMVEDFTNLLEQHKLGNYPTLFNNKEIKDYSDFFKAVHTTTEMGRGAGPWLAIDVGSKALAISGSLIAGRTMGIPAGATVLGGYVGMVALTRMLANRNAAPVILNIVKGQPLGMSVAAASRVMGNAMARQPVTLELSNGQKVLGMYDNNGQINVQ